MFGLLFFSDGVRVLVGMHCRRRLWEGIWPSADNVYVDIEPLGEAENAWKSQTHHLCVLARLSCSHRVPPCAMPSITPPAMPPQLPPGMLALPSTPHPIPTNRQLPKRPSSRHQPQPWSREIAALSSPRSPGNDDLFQDANGLLAEAVVLLRSTESAMAVTHTRLHTTRADGQST